MHKLADLMMHELSLQVVHELISIEGMHLDNHVQRIYFYSMVILVNEQLSFPSLMPAYEENN